MQPHQVLGGTRFYSTSVHLTVYLCTSGPRKVCVLSFENSYYSYPLVEFGCHGHVRWYWATLAKCSPIPNNGFRGWLALGGVPMAGAAKSDRTCIPVREQRSSDFYTGIWFLILTAWCESILLTLSDKCAVHYEKQRRLYWYDHVLQLGWAKSVLADICVYATIGRRKVCTHCLLPPCGDFYYLSG